uniref:Uncharacterized protein n=1 Tax=Equus asinus asinus TaxID=83772 RepID=A0A8C4KTP1_EQUAS
LSMNDAENIDGDYLRAVGFQRSAPVSISIYNHDVEQTLLDAQHLVAPEEETDLSLKKIILRQETKHFEKNLRLDMGLVKSV